MNHDNRHQNYGQQFGFDHYDLPPGRKGLIAKIFGENMAAKMSSPLFATAALLLTGAAFAGIIIASYPSDPQTNEAIPTVQADASAYKEAPSEAGGMEIANRDTTIFQTMADGQASESAPVENLLADEKPIDKLAAFQRQVEEISAEDATAPAEESDAAPSVAETATMAAAEPSDILALKSKEAAKAEEKAAEEKVIAKAKELAAPTNVARNKIVPAPEPVQENLASAAPTKIASAADVDIPEPVPPGGTAAKAEANDASTKPTIHKAGENPETLEYVRTVLDRKDGIPPAKEPPAPPKPAPTQTASAADTAKAAEQASKVEPASGMAATAGSHYIQLGSVTSESGAASEWSKFQKAYATQLKGLSYRVQKADLDKGTFYRIQAGPISKESAKTLCDSIKAQKPGGCLVTQ